MLREDAGGWRGPTGSPFKAEESKRIARVLRIVQLISSEPGRWRRPALAARYGLSERQIDNDLQLIRHALKYDLRRSTKGYYFETSPPPAQIDLTVAEGLALSLAARAALSTGAVEDSVLQHALSRLERGLPPPVIPYLRAVSIPVGYGAPAPHVQPSRQLAALERAMVEGRRLWIRYRSASRNDKSGQRVIAPYELIPYHNSWMVVAEDSVRHDVRIFRVDRIEDFRVTSETYQIPPDFDIEEYMGAAWGMLRGQGGDPVPVILEFDKKSSRWVRGRIWHVSQEEEEIREGCIRLRFHCSVSDELIRWVLSFGERVRVQSPDELRRSLRLEAQKIALANGPVD